MKSLVVIASHPIQYYAPWFRYIHQNTDLQLEIIYLWNTIENAYHDREFGRSVSWDVDLLSGYPSRFVENRSTDPGTYHWGGLRNPKLFQEVMHLRPSAVLMTTLFNQSSFEFLLRHFTALGRSVPLLFRGDSHLLAQQKSPLSFKSTAKRILFSRFQAVLPVGKANQDYFSHFGVPQERLFMAPHAIDSSRFLVTASNAESEARAWRNQLGIADDCFVFLFVGKLIPKKRPDQLLEAFQKLVRDLPSEEQSKVALIYCGTGELESSLRSSSKGNPQIHYLGFQNQQRMPAVYCLGNMLVLPSEGHSETWGLCVNEAMTLGRPAIVSSHVGCQQDLILDGETGYHFPAGNVEALAKSLMASCKNQALCKKMGANAQEHIKTYSYQSATQGLLDAVEVVCDQRIGRGWLFR